MSLLLDLFWATVVVSGFIISITLLGIIAVSLISSTSEDWRKVK